MILFLESLVDQWERGILDPEDFVRQVRRELLVEKEIERLEGENDGR